MIADKHRGLAKGLWEAALRADIDGMRFRLTPESRVVFTRLATSRFRKMTYRITLWAEEYPVHASVSPTGYATMWTWKTTVLDHKGAVISDRVGVGSYANDREDAHDITMQRVDGVFRAKMKDNY